MDGFEDGRRRPESQPGSPVFVGNEYGKITGLRKRPYEGRWVGTVTIERLPVAPGILGTEPLDRLFDLAEVVV
jgi:hypothetical protein